VSEVVLQSARVVAIVGELEAAGVPQHVWMHAEWHLGGLAEPCHEVMEAKRAHRSTALRDEYISPSRRVFTLQLAQGADLVAPDRMDAWRSMLGSADMQSTSIKLDLMPLQVAGLACSQSMAIGDQDHGCVAVSVTAELAGPRSKRCTLKAN
jgi:hypothetical protein